MIKHEPTIFEARRGGIFRWLCSCGAESTYFKGRKAAENDHDEHVTSLTRVETMSAHPRPPALHGEN